MSNIRETGHLLTEKVNPNTTEIDSFTTFEIIEAILKEDLAVTGAISREKENISKAVDFIVGAIRSGGRLFFIGAGTSGRLGIVESAECPPTFGTDPELVQAIIAGGNSAITDSIEGAEDSLEESVQELKKREFSKNDLVVGIAASASTPFVKSAIEYASEIGSKTVLVTCNEIENPKSDVTISLLVGPEVIVGSTRLKAGTATKMVLNMLTTASMIRLGKTYGNLMVDVQPKSAKLKDRAIRIVMELCGIDRENAQTLLENADWNVKASVLMNQKSIDLDEAVSLLESNEGFLKKALS